jgi:GMP synthase (glutamine-hydrolysing)
VEAGFFSRLADLESYADDLDALQAQPNRRDLAWRYGLGEEIVGKALREREIQNWIDSLSTP